MIKSLIRLGAGLITLAGDAISAITPAPADKPEAPEPTGLYDADEMPAVEDIETAAADYQKATEQARAGDRGKRAAKKILDRLPAGRYGSWIVSRIESNRQTADLDAIRAIFKTHGLGPVPMKQAAPSLRVELAAEQAEPAADALVAA
ncbi:hypothetical protein [Streptomyces wuyuanensis]|uniref:hypothetical protein n=1 Tax=Streptomyces wuyuanensis TaxID=1196353 RepID=UPI00342A12F5